ncbi:unnamed protein product [Prunus armeniaca]|uniref:Uncharacterized protein n=1 Tax=Prunus armeniaca TaxID=36596 RepID=A0A6J5XUX9_PRUAR|nr:unnamed protein product [Prunus armeniaca]
MTVYTATAAGVVPSSHPKEEIYKEISMFECDSERCNAGLSFTSKEFKDLSNTCQLLKCKHDMLKIRKQVKNQ